jgi:hypothetical protein
MMRRFLLVVMLTAVANSLTAQSAAAPDLSGAWVLNLQKSKLGKDTKITAETIVITCSGSSIEFRETINGNDSLHAYVTDGKEHSLGRVESQGIWQEQGQSTSYVTKAGWNKSALVTGDITREAIASFPVVDVSHFVSRWTLSRDGHILKQNYTGSDQHQILVYDKQ